MKKIAGIFVIAIFAAVMFLNTNIANDSSNSLDLKELASLNTAEADCWGGGWPMSCNSFGRCSMFGSGAAC